MLAVPSLLYIFVITLYFFPPYIFKHSFIIYSLAICYPCCELFIGFFKWELLLIISFSLLFKFRALSQFSNKIWVNWDRERCSVGECISRKIWDDSVSCSHLGSVPGKKRRAFLPRPRAEIWALVLWLKAEFLLKALPMTLSFHSRSGSLHLLNVKFHTQGDHKRTTWVFFCCILHLLW